MSFPVEFELTARDEAFQDIKEFLLGMFIAGIGLLIRVSIA